MVLQSCTEREEYDNVANAFVVEPIQSTGQSHESYYIITTLHIVNVKTFA